MSESVGGDPSLDFHNTVSWANGEPVGTERLNTYDDLLSWGVERGLLTATERDTLLAAAVSNPEGASRTLARGRELRVVLNRVFGAMACGSTVSSSAINRLNAFLSNLPLRLGAQGPGGFAWEWGGSDEDLERVLWPVVWAAATLLQSEDAVRVGACANDQCGWLFVDRSRRHNRKWCDMRDCGNRAKARRHYHRHKKRNPH